MSSNHPISISRPACEPVRSRSIQRPDERGQTLTLLLLILITLILTAVVSIAFGQSLIRRMHAQMVVDAAAFAGASKQAEGLNTIAEINKKALFMMQEIHVSMEIPYMDEDGTTWVRTLSQGIAGGDWAGDAIETYQSVFDLLNLATTLVNTYYSPLNILTGPSKVASDVVEANFGGGNDSDRLFAGEQPVSHGMVILADNPEPWQLVKLTDPKEYKLGGYNYIPYLNNWMVTCTCSIAPVHWPCCVLKADMILVYAGTDLYYGQIKPWVDPIEMKFGSFYDNPEGRDVRCTYFLKIRNTPVFFGKEFFNDIPPIVVVAAAKPYDGYLGDEFEQWGIPMVPAMLRWTHEGDNEIRAEYKAKLVPVTKAAMTEVAVRSGEDIFDARWLAVIH